MFDIPEYRLDLPTLFSFFLRKKGRLFRQPLSLWFFRGLRPSMSGASPTHRQS